MRMRNKRVVLTAMLTYNLLYSQSALLWPLCAYKVWPFIALFTTHTMYVDMYYGWKIQQTGGERSEPPHDSQIQQGASKASLPACNNNIIIIMGTTWNLYP